MSLWDFFYNMYGKHKSIGPLYQLMHYTGTIERHLLPPLLVFAER